MGGGFDFKMKSGSAEPPSRLTWNAANSYISTLILGKLTLVPYVFFALGYSKRKQTIPSSTHAFTLGSSCSDFGKRLRHREHSLPSTLERLATITKNRLYLGRHHAGRLCSNKIYITSGNIHTMKIDNILVLEYKKKVLEVYVGFCH